MSDAGGSARVVQNSAPRSPSLTAQALSLTVARTVGFALSVALPLFLVRALDQYTYGLYKQVFVLIGSAQALLPLGMGLSAFYFLPREPARQRSVVLNVVLFHGAVGLIALAVMSAWPGTVAYLFGSPELSAYSPLIGMLLLATLISSILDVIAAANREVFLSAAFIIGAQLTKTVTLIAVVFVWRSVPAILYASMFQCVLQAIALFWYLDRRFPGFLWAFDRQFFIEQFRYALPLGLSGLVYTLQRDLHNYVVSAHFGPASYAVYSVGCFQLPLIGMLRESIAVVMLSRTSELQHRGAHREILLVLANAMRKLALIYWPTMFFLLVCRREFITALFTRAYLDSVPMFVVNLAVLPAMVLMTDAVFRAYAEHRFYPLKVQLAVLAFVVACLSLGALRFGMIGASVVVAASTLLERGLAGWRAASILSLKRSDAHLFRGVLVPALAAAAAAVPTWALRGVISGMRPVAVLALCAAFYGAVYVAAALAMGAVTKDDRRDIGVRLSAWRKRLAGMTR